MRKINFIVLSLILHLSLLSVTKPVSALTLADIKVQVRRLINDRADPRIKFTDGEILSYVNEAQREIVNQTWCLTNRTTQSLSVQTTYYTLPTDLIAIEHVEFRDSANRTRELLEVSEKAKQQENPDYERITGPPMEYFVRNSTYSTSYTLQIAFLPIPSSTTATGTATIDYYSIATDLSSDTDVPFDGIRNLYPYHYALVYSVSAKLKMSKGDPSATTDLSMAQAYVALMKDRLGMMPNYNPGFRPGTGK